MPDMELGRNRRDFTDQIGQMATPFQVIQAAVYRAVFACSDVCCINESISVLNMIVEEANKRLSTINFPDLSDEALLAYGSQLVQFVEKEEPSA